MIIRMRIISMRAHYIHQNPLNELLAGTCSSAILPLRRGGGALISVIVSGIIITCWCLCACVCVHNICLVRTCVYLSTGDDDKWKMCVGISTVHTHTHTQRVECFGVCTIVWVFALYGKIRARTHTHTTGKCRRCGAVYVCTNRGQTEQKIKLCLCKCVHYHSPHSGICKPKAEQIIMNV